MSVVYQDSGLSPRGFKDAARHREKIKEAIAKDIGNIIADASIITRKNSQTIKIPVRGIKSYKFINKREGGIGVGQGESEDGDIIGRRPAGDNKPGKAGNEPGVDYLETEIEMEELIKMMLADLGLPNLKRKPFNEIETPKGWKINSIEKTGIRLDKKRTLKEAIKREAGFIRVLMEGTEKTEEECRNALAAAKGDLTAAKEILLSRCKIDCQNIVYFSNDDLRYRILDKDIEYSSNAVVLAMMDVSGSMDAVKKYFARSFFFWLVEFLRQIYKQVNIRFISHTTEAKIVGEDEFFHKGESGGTYCHTAYDLAQKLVETEYNPQKWNIYAVHFSDGDDFDEQATIVSADKLMKLGTNMLGYCEVHAGEHYGSTSTLIKGYTNAFQLKKTCENDFEIFASQDNKRPFVGVVLKEKTHLLKALKEILKKERFD